MKLPNFIRTNVSLASHSTLGVGGPANHFTEITHNMPFDFQMRVAEACEFARDNELDIFVFGRGSNVMFADSGFRGLVLHMALLQVHFQHDQLWADAGVSVSRLVSLYEKGSAGLECFAGLPGTVGGAIYGNAGCYGGQFWDVVEKIMFFDGEYFQTWKTTPNMFGYRRSIFKNNPSWIIVQAQLKFEPKDGDQVSKETQRIRKLRKDCQPKERSVGCIFKNPVSESLLGAGLLIDLCGLKGMRVGGAMISKEHGNFFVNLGGAKASDFIELIEIAKARVFEKFGVLLEEEIIRVGEF